MKTKKFLKIALLVVIAALFIWTFVFLYQKSGTNFVGSHEDYASLHGKRGSDL